MTLLIRCCLIAMFFWLAQTAVAQPYPSRPIHLIVAYPAGGATDLVGRAVGAKMSEALGQPVIVENRSGGAGAVGTDAVAKSAPDGYTLLLAPSAFSIAPSLNLKLPYDTLADFAPVGLVATGAQVLAANPTLPVQSVKDLIALAKSRPGQLNFASSGIGTTPHLGGELFNAMAGTKLVHVPYKGDAGALADLAGGHIELGFMSISLTLPQARAGKVRALAVTSAKRSAMAPDIPTVSESGVPGYELTTWWGVLAPARTPREIVGRISATILKMGTEPEFKQRLAAAGIDAEPSSPEQFAELLRNELDKVARLVKAAGIKPE